MSRGPEGRRGQRCGRWIRPKLLDPSKACRPGVGCRPQDRRADAKPPKTGAPTTEEAAARKLADRLTAAPVVLTARVGDQGRLYGSITSADIADQLSAHLGQPIDKRKIELDDPIRQLGSMRSRSASTGRSAPSSRSTSSRRSSVRKDEGSRPWRSSACASTKAPSGFRPTTWRLRRPSWAASCSTGRSSGASPAYSTHGTSIGSETA